MMLVPRCSPELHKIESWEGAARELMQASSFNAPKSESIETKTVNQLSHLCISRRICARDEHYSSTALCIWVAC